jgi:hypothetical protein
VGRTRLISVMSGHCHCYDFQTYLLILLNLLRQMHSALAEVAAAKARMFVNKPDGSM